ncbi:MAG TPA: toll/interleukin-1 receptor domain-containing protein [Vitreimonas sp.]|nr:toll/interleukin-1 receptor domain-containing protein [Vitreimonas sp.]
MGNRYNFTDIDNLLEGLGLPEPEWGNGWQSVEAYAKVALRHSSDETLLEMAADLQIDTSAVAAAVSDPPATWRDGQNFRLFISHRSQQKHEANRLREELLPFGISAFVAHDDIEPTADWQREIDRALRTSDALLALLAEGFSGSPWTQQEIGYALARRLRVISLKFDGREDPKGFIAKEQSLSRAKMDARQVAAEIERVLSTDASTRDRFAYYKQLRAKLSEQDDEIPF